MKQNLLLLSAACLLYTAAHAEHQVLSSDKTEVVLEADVGPPAVVLQAAITEQVSMVIQEEVNAFPEALVTAPMTLAGFQSQEIQPPNRLEGACKPTTHYMVKPGYLGAGSGGFGDRR